MAQALLLVFGLLFAAALLDGDPPPSHGGTKGGGGPSFDGCSRHDGHIVCQPTQQHHPDSINRSAVRAPRLDKRPNEKASTDPHQDCRPERVLGHPLGGIIHRLCRRVHPLLGGEIFYLALAGFGFMALAGLGGSLVFNHFDRNRKWRYAGGGLLLICFPVGLLCLFLGLP